MKILGLAAFCSLLLCGHSSALAQTSEWIRQLGTSDFEEGNGVSADGLGNVYLAGMTEGTLDGASAGGKDAFVSKYDIGGNLQWTRQLGTSSSDLSKGVSADGLGNVYISGWTEGSLDGTNAGGADAFVTKYDASGTLAWTRQLGTSDSEVSNAVSADGLGNVYISGRTSGTLDGAPNDVISFDAFVSKYDASGNLQWTRQLGDDGTDWSSGVSADGLGNVYMSGWTVGDLEGTNAGGFDAFVTKYDADGNLQWTRQLGTSADELSNGVSADGLGNVYLSGKTLGDLEGTNAGGQDAFVSKYDASGTLQWTRQLGSEGSDISWGVSADKQGNVYISGETTSDLDGTNVGGTDAFISKYDTDGNLQWTRQLGTASTDWSRGVSTDGQGTAYLAGWTLGSLGATSAGSWDAFVAKYSSADFDADGDIDGADFLKWQRGESPNPLSATDLALWEAEYGGATALSAIASIPEPSALLLASLGLLMRWRKWSRYGNS